MEYRGDPWYLGYHKIYDMVHHGNSRVPQRVVQGQWSTNGNVGTSLSVTHPNVSLNAGANASRTVTWEELRVERQELERSDLAAMAADILEPIVARAQPVGDGSNAGTGRLLTVGGPVRFKVRSHNLWQHENTTEGPRAAFWLWEVPNERKTPSGEGTVTWVFLSGSAEGQLSTEFGDDLGEWRGGSNTEALFEKLYSADHEVDVEDLRPTYLEPDRIVETIRSLISFGKREDAEAVFRCISTYEIPVEEADLKRSTFESSTDLDTGPIVSRVVLGTPYFVQHQNRPTNTLSAVETGPKQHTLWHRVWSYLTGKNQQSESIEDRSRNQGITE